MTPELTGDLILTSYSFRIITDMVYDVLDSVFREFVNTLITIGHSTFHWLMHNFSKRKEIALYCDAHAIVSVIVLVSCIKPQNKDFSNISYVIRKIHLLRPRDRGNESDDIELFLFCNT